MSAIRKHTNTELPKAKLRRSHMAARIWVFGYLGLWVFLSGCSAEHLPMGRVSGEVTIDGQPVSSGVIHFIPEAGPAASAVLDDEGRYRLTTYHQGDGAVTGRHSVYFAPQVDEDYLADYTDADYMAGKIPPEPPRQQRIPTAYLSPSTSGLSATVSDGSNTFDFALSAK